MGGSGGTETASQQRAELPEEFKPLFNTAVPQIQALQKAVPLVDFGQPNPPGVAPLSGRQQSVFDLLPNILSNTQGLNSLQSLTQPTNQLLSNIGRAGGPTTGAQSALDSLAASGRVGGSTLRGAGAAPQIPNFGVQSSVIPGVTAPQIQERFAAAQAPITGGVGGGGTGFGGGAGNIGLPPSGQIQLDNLLAQLNTIGQQVDQFTFPQFFQLSETDVLGGGGVNNQFAVLGPNGQFINTVTGEPINPSANTRSTPVPIAATAA